MFIRKLQPRELHPAYNILFHVFYPWDDVVTPPFGVGRGVVEPGGRTSRHNHHEAETFIITAGSGRLSVNDETREVGTGHVIYFPPFSRHLLENTSNEPLEFMTIWWEDMNLLPERAASTANGPACRAGKTLVIPVPPTSNGDLHVGHLSGPYIAADILRRYRILRGGHAWYATGSDDHQIYVEYRGRQEGRSPSDIATSYGDAIGETLAAAGIRLDSYLRTRWSDNHRELVREMVAVLHRRGLLEERVDESPWCETCDRYLFESYISGRCPHCGSGTGGNICEECGRPNDCVDIVDAVCNVCGSAPGRRMLRRLYFPLQPHAARLAEHWAGIVMHPHVRTMCERLLTDGLPDVPVAHYCGWGIPVPIPGYEDQRIAAWFEMNAFYLMLAEGVDGKSWRDHWCGGDTEIVQFHGFDNSFYLAAMLPAVLSAYDPSIRLPASVVNEFYRLEGAKFSTSRRHAVWGRELLARYPSDVVRFHLACDRPELTRTNFTLPALRETVERELAGLWQPWLSEVFENLAGEFGSVVPATGLWLREHHRFYDDLRAIGGEIAAACEPDDFSPQRMTRKLRELVRLAAEFSAGQRHWRGVAGRGDERRTAVALELAAAKALAIWASPVMPEFGAVLWRDLGFDQDISPLRWEDVPAWVPAGQVAAARAGGYFVHEPALDPVAG